jgi:hypothetical protein
MFEVAFYFLDCYEKMLKIMRLPPDTREKNDQGSYATLYTRLQIRDAFNVLCSLIILRTSDGPIRLNRIGSNRLGRLFGKIRVRCREAKTMKRFVSALPEGSLKLQTNHFL